MNRIIDSYRSPNAQATLVFLYERYISEGLHSCGKYQPITNKSLNTDEKPYWVIGGGTTCLRKGEVREPITDPNYITLDHYLYYILPIRDTCVTVSEIRNLLPSEVVGVLKTRVGLLNVYNMYD